MSSLPEKWWANTYGSPLAAASRAEYIDDLRSQTRGSPTSRPGRP
jgi:hypothetical protein